MNLREFLDNMGLNDNIGGSNSYDSPPQTVIRKEQDFLLKSMILTAYNGKSYDLTNHRAIFEYKEDLFSNAISGSLELIDAIDYQQFMPLIGEEKLKVILTRQDESGKAREGGLLPDLEMNFRIYKVSGRQLQNEKVQTYTMHLISEELIKNLKQKVYRCWDDTFYSDMVDEIYGEFISIGKPIVIEPTLYEQDFCCSNMNPYEFFHTIAARSISAEGNGEAYIFYEDREAFYYVTLGKLLIGGTKEKYGHAPRKVWIPNEGKFRPIDLPIDIEVKNLEHYHWNGQHDILRNLEGGMYAQHLTTVDPVRQVFEFIPFDLTAEFESFKHVDKERFFTDALDALAGPFAHTKLMHTNKDHDIVPWIADREPGIKPFKLEEYVMRRTSHMHQINNFKMGMTVTGDPRRKVGDIIEVTMPQVAGDAHDRRPQELDRYFQGRYLVTSIKHRLTQTGYSMDLEIIKDTFFKPIAHTDVVDRYKDIY